MRKGETRMKKRTIRWNNELGIYMSVTTKIEESDEK